MPDFNQALRILSASENRPLLTQLNRGIEKESLRVNASGHIAQTSHPKALGSALTHPRITTDYSESLLEMITPPIQSVADVLTVLEQEHQIVYQNIGDEMLWVHSMPCSFIRDSDVPVADYGSSNVAKMKKVYRYGLGHRYGRIMQTIAGIHYNWSVPDECLSLLQIAATDSSSFQDYKTQRYFDLIRNFRRYTWLLLYLFGAAPAVCRSYIKGREHQLVPVGSDEHSLHTPYATSLRMGNLGYQSTAQSSLTVCYNGLENYIDTLREALTQPYPPYESLGVKDSDGNYQQLSTHLLQIENEFYGTIRPKRTARSGETPIKALSERGVEYIEVRCLDLNPFSPIGINQQQIYFLDIFLLYCLISESSEANEEQYRDILSNQEAMVYHGRDPELRLKDNGNDRSVCDWGRDLFQKMAPVAELLDQANTSCVYSDVLKDLQQRIDNPELTPSAQILNIMKEEKITYFQLALRHARENRDYFKNKGSTPSSVENYYQQLAEKSLRDQIEIEQQDTLSFEDYLANYYQQYQQ